MVPSMTNNSFTKKNQYPTLENPDTNWDEEITYDGYQAAALGLVALHKVIDVVAGRKTPMAIDLDGYVDYLNTLEVPNWVRDCVATGIQPLREKLLGGGYNPGAITEMVRASQTLYTAIRRAATLKA